MTSTKKQSEFPSATSDVIPAAIKRQNGQLLQFLRAKARVGAARVKKAKTFFVVSMITVPIIVITAGFFAVLLALGQGHIFRDFSQSAACFSAGKNSREASAPMEQAPVQQVKSRDSLNEADLRGPEPVEKKLPSETPPSRVMSKKESRPLHHVDIRPRANPTNRRYRERSPITHS